MAIESRVWNIVGALAGEDLSATSGLTGFNSTGQYLFAKIKPGTDNTILHCSAVGDRPCGIIQDNPESGSGVGVMALGMSKLVAGATLVAGDEVGTDAAGRGVVKNATSTGANYGQYVAAECWRGATVGTLATVILKPAARIH